MRHWKNSSLSSKILCWKKLIKTIKFLKNLKLMRKSINPISHKTNHQLSNPKNNKLHRLYPPVLPEEASLQQIGRKNSSMSSNYIKNHCKTIKKTLFFLNHNVKIFINSKSYRKNNKFSSNKPIISFLPINWHNLISNIKKFLCLSLLHINNCLKGQIKKKVL